MYNTRESFRFKRIEGRKSDRIPAVLFEKITRKDADENITNGIKFLLSYGFYKFGLEVCPSDLPEL